MKIKITSETFDLKHKKTLYNRKDIPVMILTVLIKIV